MGKWNKNLFLVLLLTFFIRFTGIWYGLPALYDPDEPFIVNNALSYGAKKSLEPSYFDYPTLYSYVLFSVYGGYFLAGKVTGSYDSPVEFASTYFLDPSAFYLIARLLSVLWGVLAVYVVYKTGRRFFSEKVGLFAALMLALSFIHVDKSHWGLLESPLVLLCALALYFIFKLNQSPTLKNTVVAGLVAGLAVSTKYNAGFIFVPLLTVCLVTFKKNPGKLFQALVLTGFSMLVGFLIATPYWLLEPDSFMQVFHWSYFQAHYGVAGHYRSVPYIWPFFEMMFIDWTVGVLMILGFFYAFFQHGKKQNILLSFVVPTLLFVGSWDRGDLHYIMPVYPALVLLGALFLSDISQYVKNRVVWSAVMVLIFVAPLVKIIHYDIQLTRPDTRTLAKRWVDTTISDGAVIGYENYAYGPNLFDPMRFLKYDTEKQVLPAALKERLLQERRLRKHYQLVNFRKDFKPPVLAKIEEKIAGDDRFEKRKAYLQSFLPDVSTMQRNHVKYLIASSFNYGRYFSQKEPARNQPSWYSFHTGKLFYQNIFTSKQLRLMQEFRPMFWNLGPVIKFYQVLDGAANAENE